MKHTEACTNKKNRDKISTFSCRVFHVAAPVVFNTMSAMRAAGEAGIDFSSGFSRSQAAVNFLFPH